MRTPRSAVRSTRDRSRPLNAAGRGFSARPPGTLPEAEIIFAQAPLSLSCRDSDVASSPDNESVREKQTLPPSSARPHLDLSSRSLANPLSLSNPKPLSSSGTTPSSCSGPILSFLLSSLSSLPLVSTPKSVALPIPSAICPRTHSVLPLRLRLEAFVVRHPLRSLSSPLPPVIPILSPVSPPICRCPSRPPTAPAEVSSPTPAPIPSPALLTTPAQSVIVSYSQPAAASSAFAALEASPCPLPSKHSA